MLTGMKWSSLAAKSSQGPFVGPMGYCFICGLLPPGGYLLLWIYTSMGQNWLRLVQTLGEEQHFQGSSNYLEPTLAIHQERWSWRILETQGTHCPQSLSLASVFPALSWSLSLVSSLCMFSLFSDSEIKSSIQLLSELMGLVQYLNQQLALPSNF